MAVYYLELRRIYIIGEIDFSTNYLNEINIGDNKTSPTFPNSFNGKCKVEVYNDEGKYIPHFHITFIDKKLSCCIYIFENRFFTHGIHKDILNKKDWKTLDAWLRAKHNRYPYYTNWEYIVYTWNMIYNLSNDPKQLSQPDYTTIKPYKEN